MQNLLVMTIHTAKSSHPPLEALEFFAGGGLARIGLAPDFQTIWANDIDPMKAQTWIRNFGRQGFVQASVHEIESATLPQNADLAWASFPCQDLSLAGSRHGLNAKRSSSFFGFTRLIGELAAKEAAPHVLVIENVCGLLNASNGADFAETLSAIDALGYDAGALEIDARLFVPQSRPRLFIIAVQKFRQIPTELILPKDEASPFHTASLYKALAKLPDDLRQKHIRWHLPAPPSHSLTLSSLLNADNADWWPQGRIDRLLSHVSSAQAATLTAIQRGRTACVGAAFRRTRTENGQKVQRTEIRFDGLAGCLRTPSGGSSRQFLIFVHGADIKVRSLDAREALRLMGVPDSYCLPTSTLAGLKVAGDGVAVPVVSWLSAHLLKPLLR